MKFRVSSPKRRLTISFQSASLHLLSNSDSTKGLFKNVMMQSGTANTLGIGGPALRQPVFDVLAEQLGCLTARSPLGCLRKVSAEDLDFAAYNATKSLGLAYTVRTITWIYLKVSGAESLH